MPVARNEFKHALQREGCRTGLWLNLGSAVSAEIVGQAGYDWALIDAEHAPYDIAAIRAQLIALAGTGTEAVVRVPVGADWILKQVLDLGARNVMVPMVESPEQAEALVRALRYPPRGTRGFGATLARASGYNAVPDYATGACDEICFIAQVESRAALASLPEICAVDGVDAVFIGPADLAADMGHIADPNTPEVLEAIDGAIETIRASGKAPGIISFDASVCAAYRDKGVRMLGVGADVHLLATAVRAARCLP